MSAKVTTPAQWKEALQDGEHVFELGGIEFTSEADCIDVAALTLHKHNAMTIRAGGGSFNGTGIVRCFDGTEPLVRFRHDRDWELRIEGVMAWGQKKRGMMLQVDYSQQSLYSDLRFEDCDSTPFDITAPCSNFDFIQLLYNTHDAVVRRANVVRWTSGLLQSDWATRSGGVTINAPADNPPHDYAEALRVTDPHNEGCHFNIAGYNRGVRYEGGYHLAATININCKAEPSIDIASCGTWLADSALYVNGVARDPQRRLSLWQRIVGWK